MSEPDDILISPQDAGRIWAWRRSSAVIVGGGVIALLVAAALLAPWLAPRDPLPSASPRAGRVARRAGKSPKATLVMTGEGTTTLPTRTAFN